MFRIQSFWTEPARFAQFLLLPLFISLNRRSFRKTTKNEIRTIIILTAIILTFSVAALFSLIVVGLLYLYTSKIESKNKYGYVLKRIKIIGLVFIVIAGTIYLYKYTLQHGYGELVIPLGKGNSIAQKIKWSLEIFKYIVTNPFGSLDSYDREITLSFAFAHVLQFGGFLSLAALANLLFRFYKEVYRRIKANSQYTLIYIGSICYLITISWVGNYFQYFYIFHLMYVATIMGKEDLKKVSA